MMMRKRSRLEPDPEGRKHPDRPALTEETSIPTLNGMTIRLNPEQEHRIAEALRSGVYQSADDVIDHALEVLHEQDEWLAANRDAINAKIHQGIEELERGEGIPEDRLDAYLRRLKEQKE
jgi:Arc/MetJ-type ribon-helix-helix transcriptional regulator